MDTRRLRFESQGNRPLFLAVSPLTRLQLYETNGSMYITAKISNKPSAVRLIDILVSRKTENGRLWSWPWRKGGESNTGLGIWILKLRLHVTDRYPSSPGLGRVGLLTPISYTSASFTSTVTLLHHDTCHRTDIMNPLNMHRPCLYRVV